jgi:hypothetical protein
LIVFIHSKSEVSCRKDISYISQVKMLRNYSNMNLYNYDKNTFEKIQGLPQGFYLSYDSEKKVVLSIKSLAGLVSALVQGCPVNLALTKDEKLTTLYIIDNERNP